MQEWVPTTVWLLILFRTKDAWTRTHEDSSFSINPSFKPYTRPRTPHRVLVMVVFSTRLNNVILTGFTQNMISQRRLHSKYKPSTVPRTHPGVTGGGSSVVVVATLLPSQYKTKLNNRHQTWSNLNLIPAVNQVELGNEDVIAWLLWPAMSLNIMT